MTSRSMRPLDVLRDEHGLIRWFLDNLELALRKMEADEPPPREFFDKALRFAHDFADEFHHIKEEHVLFVRLAQKENGTIDGQLDALRQQHEGARNYLSALNTALDGYAAEQPVQVEQVRKSVAAYIFLLRNHMHMEDHVFFPLVTESLSSEEERQLHHEFEKARKKAGREAFEVNQKLVVEMGSMLVQH
jgi:hemerythrin-like domain-containing protein